MSVSCAVISGKVSGHAHMATGVALDASRTIRQGASAGHGKEEPLLHGLQKCGQRACARTATELTLDASRAIIQGALAGHWDREPLMHRLHCRMGRVHARTATEVALDASRAIIQSALADHWDGEPLMRRPRSSKVHAWARCARKALTGMQKRTQAMRRLVMGVQRLGTVSTWTSGALRVIMIGALESCLHMEALMRILPNRCERAWAKLAEKAVDGRWHKEQQLRSMFRESRRLNSELGRELNQAIAVAQHLEEQQALRNIVELLECAICLDSIEHSKGLTCGSGGHFVCDECLSGYVRSKTDDEELRLLAENGECLSCVCHGCDAIYLDSSIAKHVPPGTFQDYLHAKLRVAEQRIAQELERDIEQRISDEASRIAAASQEERRLRAARKHVINSILTLACPRCGQAFVEELDGGMGFEGCFALTCSRAGCGCGFCAYCLQDCGNDAHAHVRRCPAGHGDVWGTQQQFLRSQKTRREQMLLQYLTDEFGDDDAMRDQVVVDVARELIDLNMDPADFLADAAWP